MGMINILINFFYHGKSSLTFAKPVFSLDDNINPPLISIHIIFFSIS